MLDDTDLPPEEKIAETFSQQADQYLTLAQTYIKQTKALERFAKVVVAVAAFLVLFFGTVTWVVVDQKNDVLATLGCDRGVEQEYRDLNFKLDQYRASYILKRDEFEETPTAERQAMFWEAKSDYEAGLKEVEHFNPKDEC